jgi:hypothetical protein
MAVVQSAGVAFFAGANTSSVVVTDLAGVAQTTLTLDGDVVDLAVTPDGSRLYAAVDGTTGEIESISTADLTAAPIVYDTDAGTVSGSCPGKLATDSESTVWFTYSCAGDALGKVDVGSDTVTDYPTAATPGDTASKLSLSAAAPNDLIVYNGGGTAPPAVWDVSGTTPALVATAATGTQAENVAVSADGSTLLVAADRDASNDIDVLARYSLPSLAFQGEAPLGSQPGSVAISPATGDVAVIGKRGGPLDDVQVYTPDGTCLLDPITSASEPLLLAYGADGSTLYVLSQPSAGSDVLGHIDGPDRTPLTASVTVSHRTVNGLVTVSGTVSAACGTSTAGLAYSVTRSNAEGTADLVDSTLDASGAFSLSDSALGEVDTYAVDIPATADTLEASARTRVDLRRKPTFEVQVIGDGVTGGDAAIGIQPTGRITNSRRPVTVDVSESADGKQTNPVKVSVEDTGQLVQIPTPTGHAVNVVVTYPGSEFYAPRSFDLSIPVRTAVEVAATVNRRHRPEVIESGRTRVVGSKILGLPALVHAGSTVLIVATFPDHGVYARTLSSGWTRLDQNFFGCAGSPTAALSGPGLVVACQEEDEGFLDHSYIPWSGRLPQPDDSAWNRMGRVRSAPAIGVLGGELMFAAESHRGGLETGREGLGWTSYKYSDVAAPSLDISGNTAAVTFTTYSDQLGYMYCNLNSCKRAVVVGTGLVGTPATYNTGKCQVLWGESKRSQITEARVCSPAGFRHPHYRVVVEKAAASEGVSAIDTAEVSGENRSVTARSHSNQRRAATPPIPGQTSNACNASK